MSTETLAASTPGSGAAPVPGMDYCIITRPDGVYADASALGSTLAAAVGDVFGGQQFFRGLDYPVLMKAIYDVGPDLGRAGNGEALIRFAAAIVPFDPVRRKLYKAVKLNAGQAEYYFEPLYLPDPAGGADVPAFLDVDEFVADMWGKGIRFGIDIGAVRAAIDGARAERIQVAQRLLPTPGVNAHIIEVASELHRSDAPRQLANGKLDLMAFQNRFPQIQKGVRLLKKVPRADGRRGFELNGAALAPATPEDVDLGALAGSGTVIDSGPQGEFLLALQTGYLNVDSATQQISIGDKIISRDGVSSRTTGNLQLTGDYEEFGEVQEKRVIEGEGITIHADVFGNIISRGGLIQLNRNLVGGTAHNARGDIRVSGVSSGAVLQTRDGEVVMNRAESCIISGTRVRIEHAANCEIMADEVIIQQAEGCAIAARKITIESAGPRKQSEMAIYALEPDSARIDEVIGAISARCDEFGALAAQRKAEMEKLTSEPDVRKYVMLASKVRKKELTLTPEQVPMFQKMATAVGPALKNIAKVSLDVKAAETEQQAGLTLLAQLKQQRSDSEGVATVDVHLVVGETTLRSMKFNPDGSSIFDVPSKDIKERLRARTSGIDVVLAASSGSISWSSDQR